MLKPIEQRTKLYEEVAERLRDHIESRGLIPGDRLPTERELSSILGVSRTSVRQGLTALRTMGLIDVRHGDGIFLRRVASDVKPELARELLAAQRAMPLILETREALETQIARLAAQRRKASDLKAIQVAIDAMQLAIDEQRQSNDADAQFHAAVAATAQNALLEDLMRQLTEPIALTRHASLSSPGRPQQALHEHEAILKAIRARDPDAADLAMRQHLQSIRLATTPSDEAALPT